MKTLEKLLKEYKIRFKETEEIDGIDYPFSLSDLNPNIDNSILIEDKDNWEVHNVNGKVAQCLKGRIIWATAKITEKPKKWVVERDEEHPMWERFWRKNIHEVDSPYYGLSHGSEPTLFCAELTDYADYQYLTLNQWAELFLDEPKEGDWCLFWDDGQERIAARFSSITNSEVYPFTGYGILGYKNCQKLSPELSAMLEKEFNKIRR